MDFRRVEPRYVYFACCCQATLLLSLLSFTIFQVAYIVAFAEDPPVETRMEKWKGAGKWAICPRYDTDDSVVLSHAGMTIPNGEGWDMPLQSIDASLTCAIADLTNVTWNTPTTKFFLCAFVRNVALWVMTDGKWYYMDNVWAGKLIWYKFTRKKHGHDSLFHTELHEIHALDFQRDFPKGMSSAGFCQHWTDFKVMAREANPHPVYIEITIDEPLVEVTTTQGVLPQLLKLFANIGGYMSLLTLFYHFVFVKKHPDSAVSQIYEARTFVGEMFAGKKPICMDAEQVVPLPLPPGLFPHLEKSKERE